MPTVRRKRPRASAPAACAVVGGKGRHQCPAPVPSVLAERIPKLLAQGPHGSRVQPLLRPVPTGAAERRRGVASGEQPAQLEPAALLFTVGCGAASCERACEGDLQGAPCWTLPGPVQGAPSPSSRRSEETARAAVARPVPQVAALASFLAPHPTVGDEPRRSRAPWQPVRAADGRARGYDPRATIPRSALSRDAVAAEQEAPVGAYPDARATCLKFVREAHVKTVGREMTRATMNGLGGRSWLGVHFRFVASFRADGRGVTDDRCVGGGRLQWRSPCSWPPRSR